MDFGKINNFKINFSSLSKKNEVSPVETNNVSDKKIDEISPCTPEYWQEALGLDMNDVDERTIRKTRRQLEAFYSDVPCDDFSFVGKYVDIAAKHGAFFLDSYVSFLMQFGPFAKTNNKEELDNLFKHSLGLMSKLDGFENEKLVPLISVMSKHNDDNEFMGVLYSILDDKNVPPNEKVTWLVSKFGQTRGLKDDDFKKFYSTLPADFKNYSDLTSIIGRVDAVGYINCSSKSDKPLYNDVKEIIESDKVPKDKFSRHLRTEFDSQFGCSKNILEFVDALKDDEKKERYSKICEIDFDGFDMRLDGLNCLLNSDSKIIQSLLDFVLKYQNESGFHTFSLPSSLIETVSALDEENFDDYCKLVLEKKSFVADRFEKSVICPYINPYTQKFDKNLYDLERAINKLFPYYDNTFKCSREMLDSQTHKISPIAADILQMCQPDKAPRNKFLCFVNGILSKVGLKKNKHSIVDAFSKHKLLDIIKAAKDYNGKFCEKNRDFIFDIISLPLNSLDYNTITLDTLYFLLQYAKDENGVVADSRIERIKKVYKNTDSINDLEQSFSVLACVKQENRDKFFDMIWNILPSKDDCLPDLSNFVRFAVDDTSGEIKEENVEF
ncbi:hypothetical protein IJ425_03915 [bacterium]|nr:hypothetical protein [bacterium]